MNTGSPTKLLRSQDRVDADQLRKTGLTELAFNTLLARFDPDREVAARKYQAVRLKLVKFFEWQGSTEPETDADKTFDRLTRKLYGGEDITDIGSYTRGVARMIMRERIKADQKTQQALTEMSQHQVVSSDEKTFIEQQSRCLDECLEQLPEDQRQLILTYYSVADAERIPLRAKLAAEMKTNLNTLRIRAYKIKRQLRACVQSCMQKGEGD